MLFATVAGGLCVQPHRHPLRQILDVLPPSQNLKPCAWNRLDAVYQSRQDSSDGGSRIRILAQVHGCQYSILEAVGCQNEQMLNCWVRVPPFQISSRDSCLLIAITVCAWEGSEIPTTSPTNRTSRIATRLDSVRA